MPLKFRLKGLAETFVDSILCPRCGFDGGEAGDEGFETNLTRVTYEGIVVVSECLHCGHIFVPADQRIGILNSSKLRAAVECDRLNTGQEAPPSAAEVRLDVERMNAERNDELH